jgi:hypothetical protein
MTDTMTSQNIDLSFWDTLYTHEKNDYIYIYTHTMPYFLFVVLCAVKL